MRVLRILRAISHRISCSAVRRPGEPPKTASADDEHVSGKVPEALHISQQSHQTKCETVTRHPKPSSQQPRRTKKTKQRPCGRRKEHSFIGEVAPRCSHSRAPHVRARPTRAACNADHIHGTAPPALYHGTDPCNSSAFLVAFRHVRRPDFASCDVGVCFNAWRATAT